MKLAKSYTVLILILCTFPAMAQMGIGTTTPQARLHVADSSVLFSASGSALIPAGNTPVSGEGRRLLWYADKGAFRTGYVNSTQWDADSIGTYSFASGYNTVSNGSGSTAMGLGSKASHQGSVALGLLNIASNDGAAALGYGSSASGLYALAFGYFTQSSGVISTAFGYQSSATGSQSISIGTNTVASGFALLLWEHLRQPILSWERL